MSHFSHSSLEWQLCWTHPNIYAARVQTVCCMMILLLVISYGKDIIPICLVKLQDALRQYRSAFKAFCLCRFFMGLAGKAAAFWWYFGTLCQILYIFVKRCACRMASPIKASSAGQSHFEFWAFCLSLIKKLKIEKLFFLCYFKNDD